MRLSLFLCTLLCAAQAFAQPGIFNREDLIQYTPDWTGERFPDGRPKDIIMPDLQKAGDLGEGQRIANLANLYYVPFAPHMVASYLGAMAASHVCASVPNFMILERQIYFHKDPMYQEIVSFDGPMVEDGFISLSEKPGIGVEINEEGMRQYAVEGVPFFE